MQTARAVAPVASLPAFTVGQIWNPYAAHYRRPFAFCNFLCPLHHGPWVACLEDRRCIGFTSFPKVPRRSADRQMGLGTHYPPDVTMWNEIKCMTLISRTSCLLATAPPLQERQALAVQWLRRFKREFTLHFPYPFRHRPGHGLLSGLRTRSRAPCVLAHRTFLRSFVPRIAPEARADDDTQFHVWFGEEQDTLSGVAHWAVRPGVNVQL